MVTAFELALLGFAALLLGFVLGKLMEEKLRQSLILSRGSFMTFVERPVSGVLLAVARIAGETAPLLFTALSNQFWTSSLSEPMASLPVTIFKFAMSPYENWQKLAWAGVFLITLAVLGLNIVARVVTRQKT